MRLSRPLNRRPGKGCSRQAGVSQSAHLSAQQGNPRANTPLWAGPGKLRARACSRWCGGPRHDRAQQRRLRRSGKGPGAMSGFELVASVIAIFFVIGLRWGPFWPPRS
jgi:hypothetical protein